MGRERDEEQEPISDRAPRLLRAILCRKCGATLTDERQAITVDGRHAHDFVNPSGVAFHVRCYGEAPGVRAIGEASTFFSWFSGHAWRIALCAACGAHLGWRFEGERVFFGLISDRIAEGEPS